jgi:hypothetical protein
MSKAFDIYASTPGPIKIVLATRFAERTLNKGLATVYPKTEELQDSHHKWCELCDDDYIVTEHSEVSVNSTSMTFQGVTPNAIDGGNNSRKDGSLQRKRKTISHARDHL